ncbi:hypothetical protein COMNV_00238 [Commensalibacter sp. Nvir]|nr:hypothetical protein COMNV_00238 [Commensalibacter sp. Nvir]
MLERLLVLLDLLASDNSPLGTFLGLLADLVPHYLGLAIPAAFCISIYSTIRKMSLNSEIDAVLSSGISLFRCTKAYLAVSIFIGLFCIILYGYIQPYARYNFRAAFFYASHAGWIPNIQSHMVVKPNDSIVMIVDKASKHGTHLSGIFIRQKTVNIHNQPIEHIILAEKGIFNTSRDNTKVELELNQGENLTLTAQNKNNLTKFKRATRILQQSDKKLTFRKRGDDERELTITELYKQLHNHTNAISLSNIRAEFHFRLIRSLSILSIPVLATGLGVIKKRKKNNWGLVIAAIILVSYDHIQQFGSTLVSKGHYTPLFALWLPLCLFFLACLSCLLITNGFPIHWSTLSFSKANQKR